MDHLDVAALEGRWVRLEPLRLEHIDALLTAANEDRAHYGYATVPDNREEMVGHVGELLAQHAAGECVPFVQIARRDERVVGSTRYLTLLARRGADRPYSVEIGGTWLAATAQRTPVNTEAKLVLLEHAFEVWNVGRAQLKSDVRNARSRAAIERLGAHFEGVLRQYQPSAAPGEEDRLRDTAMYSITRDEWPEVHAALRARLAGAS
ncbi:MAG TPA: GNAT family protein [Acidimicrobiales bacterium]|nr:GNAT family protein [Acidimicrobiales bacterium]